MNTLQSHMFKSLIPFFLQLKDGIIFSELTGVHSSKLRFIKILESHRLITRKQDIKDLRRSPIMLTKKGEILQGMLYGVFLETDEKDINKKPKGEGKKRKCQTKKEKTRK